MKSIFDTPIFKSEDDCQTEVLGKVGIFLSEQSIKTAEIKSLNKPKPGSFGEMASFIVGEVVGTFNENYTLSKVASGVSVGSLFYYKDVLLVKTPFNTIVSAQTYVDTLQNRVLELTTVPTEVEIYNLKRELLTVTSGTFFDLIKLAFKRLFKGESNG